MGSQLAGVSYVMSAHLEVIEADILGVLSRPIALSLAQRRGKTNGCRSARGTFQTDQITALLTKQPEVHPMPHFP